MSKVKLAVVYYSSTGTNFQLSKWAEEAAKEHGADVKVLKVPETATKNGGAVIWIQTKARKNKKKT